MLDLIITLVIVNFYKFFFYIRLILSYSIFIIELVYLSY